MIGPIKHNSKPLWFYTTVALLFAPFAIAQSIALDDPTRKPSAKIWFNPDYIAQIQVGLICKIKTDGTFPAPDTDVGTTHKYLEQPKFDFNDTTVPAILGRSFGVKARSVSNSNIRNIRISVTHPPTGPKRTTVESWNGSFVADEFRANSFTFDYPHELVLGKWVFEAHKNLTLLYRVEFMVVDPDQEPFLSHICDAKALTS